MNYRTSFICIRLSRLLWLMTAIFLVCFCIVAVLRVKGVEHEEEKYFLQARNARDKLNEQSVKNLKGILDDPKASGELKKSASEKYIRLIEDMDKETRIEILLKGKGYEEVLCDIDGNYAKILLKSHPRLQSYEIDEIEKLVKNNFKIGEVKVRNGNFRGSFYGSINQGLKSWFFTYTEFVGLINFK